MANDLERLPTGTAFGWTSSELDDALDFRRAIEPAIVELAAERHDEEQLILARELLAESEGVPPTGFRDADSRFHLALASMAGSRRLSAAEVDVQLRLSRLLAGIPILDESIRHSHNQHRRILRAIGARDGGAARTIMLEHLEATEDLFTGLG